MISAIDLFKEMEKHATPREIAEIKCMRKYFDDQGIIVDYSKLPKEYKLD